MTLGWFWDEFGITLRAVLTSVRVEVALLLFYVGLHVGLKFQKHLCLEVIRSVINEIKTEQDTCRNIRHHIFISSWTS